MKQCRKFRFKSGIGQSILETVVGIIVLIPIVLFLFDIASLVLANIANDNLAKSCARAAASAVGSEGFGTSELALKAARNTAEMHAESSLIGKTGASFVTGFYWNSNASPPVVTGSTLISVGAGSMETPMWPDGVEKPVAGDLGVITTMRVKLPVPFPLVPDSFEFRAKAVEPIVSLPASAGSLGSGPPSKGTVSGVPPSAPPAP